MVTKLSIYACDVDETGTITVQSAKFEAQLNPSSYEYNYGIVYDDEKAEGRAFGQPKFSRYEREKVGFNFMLDGTGVAGAIDVKSQLQSLNGIVYQYSGSNHQPNVVKLLWGGFIFFGRLTSMTVSHTLFKPTGESLRAKVTLNFVRYVGANEEALLANRSSPDLTHLVEVRAGDTLPLLCHRIYKNSGYYLEVARINGITNFRNIRPGARLNFPPLR